MFKKICFQIHWFIGITAGTLLMLIGMTGALLSFSDEMIEALNPGVITVPRQAAALLSPVQLIEKIQAEHAPQRVLMVNLHSNANGAVHTVRITFAPDAGQRRGAVRYADPYSATLLPALRAEPFFKWIERLHRFLLLPNATGKLITGSAALCLLLLTLSGLYLRWPSHALRWRAWFKLDFSLQGRSFLWHLHSMLGTWALLMYVVLSSTGLYWSFDWVKDPLNRLAEQPAAPKQEKLHSDAALPEALSPTQLARALHTFNATVPRYDSVTIRLPERAAQALQISYLLPDAAHDRARNVIRIDARGNISEHQLYSEKSATGRLLESVYPLHMGSYFGLPGRIAMTIAALGLPLFGVTGWMLYLDRRRKKRAIAQARAALLPSDTTSDRTQHVLIVFASQSGYAEQIALRSAAALHAAGGSATVQSIAHLSLEQLRHHRRVLFVVSSFGDGDAPDSARGFTQRLLQQPGATLSHLHYGVLALGDRHYAHFCGYGHTLDHHLQSQGAQPQFAMIEVDRDDAVALAQWQHALADFCGLSEAASMLIVAPSVWQHWQLQQRIHLNPGSQGAPIFHLALQPPPGALLSWQSGALIELMPRHAPQRVAYLLQTLALDGALEVLHHGLPCTLADALARSVLPVAAAPTAQTLVDRLQDLTPRRYSIASIAQDGTLQLLVRQERHDDGLGLASGWLSAHAAIGDTLQLRVLDNPGFALGAQDVPGIFIGNGSGMAGLRAHLRTRAQMREQQGQSRNWLLFGERNRAYDFHYAGEIGQWQHDGLLERLDLAFSRDQAQRIYVQDKLLDAAATLRTWLADGAIIYVCGSIDGMAAGVDAALQKIIGGDELEQLITAGRYRRDVY